MKKELEKMFLYGLRAFSDAIIPSFREDMPMAKTVTRPKIEVQPVYLGGRDMREAFISLLVNEVRRGKTSPRTFEIIKDTEYNGDRK